MLGNFGLHVFCCFSPKMARITLNYIAMQMKELTVKRAITRHEVQLPFYLIQFEIALFYHLKS